MYSGYYTSWWIQSLTLASQCYVLNSEVGFPIRKSPDQRFFTSPRSLSRCSTSFIASYRQGIHHLPFSIYLDPKIFLNITCIMNNAGNLVFFGAWLIFHSVAWQLTLRHDTKLWCTSRTEQNRLAIIDNSLAIHWALGCGVTRLLPSNFVSELSGLESRLPSCVLVRTKLIQSASTSSCSVFNQLSRRHPVRRWMTMARDNT